MLPVQQRSNKYHIHCLLFDPHQTVPTIYCIRCEHANKHTTYAVDCYWWSDCIQYYIHCKTNLYNLFEPALETGRKASLWWVQINFIFNDNVCIVCLSCNIKKYKTPAKLSGNNWNKRRSNWFHGVIRVWFVTQTLILLLFLSVALHASGTRNGLLGPWPNNTEVYMTPLLILKFTQLLDKLLLSIYTYMLYQIVLCRIVQTDYFYSNWASIRVSRQYKFVSKT